MKSVPAIGWALAGAALASAAFLIIPGMGPGHEPGVEETEPAAKDAVVAGNVSLDNRQIEKAGIQLIALKSSIQTSTRTGFARALDLSPLAAINSEIVASRAALSASEADASRQQALAAQDQSASVRSVEVARAQARADRARVTLAQRRIGLEYGSGLARLTNGLDGLIAQAADGLATIVRLDFQDGSPVAGTVVTISDGKLQATAQVLGPAVAVDPNLQSAGALALVRGPIVRSLAVGKVMTATIANQGLVRTGVLVPRDAIVRTQGGLWVYRSEGKGLFRRVELKDASAQDAGWFVSAGLRAGDRVVTGGSTVLLGIESGPPAEDE